MKMIFKYLINTSWKQKVADWKEYCHIKSKMSQAYENIRIARNNLVLAVPYKSPQAASARACIVAEHGKDIGAGVNFERPCPHFATPYGYVNCVHTDCTWYEKNRAYKNAADRYNTLYKQYSEFWKNRFALSK